MVSKQRPHILWYFVIETLSTACRGCTSRFARTAANVTRCCLASFGQQPGKERTWAHNSTILSQPNPILHPPYPVHAPTPLHPSHAPLAPHSILNSSPPVHFQKPTRVMHLCLAPTSVSTQLAPSHTFEDGPAHEHSSRLRAGRERSPSWSGGHSPA